MPRTPGGGLLGRLLSGLRVRPVGGGPSGGDEAARHEAARRLEAARDRLKQEIPPPEDPAAAEDRG